MITYLDRTGAKIEFAEWAARHLAPEYSTLRVTERDDLRVSTIWVGATRPFDEPDSPSIFETEVFGGEQHGEVRAYSSEDAALEGHREMCEQVFHGDVPQDAADAALDEVLSSHQDVDEQDVSDIVAEVEDATEDEDTAVDDATDDVVRIDDELPELPGDLDEGTNEHAGDERPEPVFSRPLGQEYQDEAREAYESGQVVALSVPPLEYPHSA